MADVGSLEEQARKRREKLMAMRKRAADKDAVSSDAKHPKEETNAELKLRNYIPLDENLVSNEQGKVKPVHVETEVSEQLDKATPTLTVKDEVDLLNLAPRKIDWDLKRDIKGKLDKLERRTQRAIAELIRDRLKESNSIGPQLAEVLSTPQSG
ncbi:coiled-coil domain-containing protein 12-like [Styela clava]